MVSCKALLLTTTAFVSSAAASSITLYDGTSFQGQAYQLNDISWTTCYDLPAFNDRASSAKWDAPAQYPTEVAFYENAGCRGNYRSWDGNKKNYPTNFAIDGIDNMVSSVKMFVNTCTNCARPPIIHAIEENATVPSEASTQDVEGANSA